MNSVNFACSGAQTSTDGTGSRHDFKPGIDFYSDSSGRQGQALMLQEYAKTHNVRAVVVLIGANDYGFADIVQTLRRGLADLAVVAEELLPATTPT